MNDNKARHRVFEIIAMLCIEEENCSMENFAVKMNVITQWDKGESEIMLRAVRFLLAANFLVFEDTKDDSGNVYVACTKEGFNAFISEHFKEASRKEIQIFWNSVITLIFSGLITVATFALVFKKDQAKPLQELQQMQQKVQEHTKAIDSIQTFLHRSYLTKADSFYAQPPR